MVLTARRVDLRKALLLRIGQIGRRSARHTAVACFLAAVALVPLAQAPPVWAHGGRLAADGCHNDRKAGTRHCHRGPNAGPEKRADGSTYYPNCATARAAGVTPIRRGQPGYGRHLDRDGDGIACE